MGASSDSIYKQIQKMNGQQWRDFYRQAIGLARNQMAVARSLTGLFGVLNETEEGDFDQDVAGKGEWQKEYSDMRTRIAQLLNARMPVIQENWTNAIFEHVPEYAALIKESPDIEREVRRSCKKFAVGFAITLDSGGPARLRKNIEAIVKKRMDLLPLQALTSAVKQWERICCQEVSRDAAVNGIDATITEGEVSIAHDVLGRLRRELCKVMDAEWRAITVESSSILPAPELFQPPTWDI